MGDGVPSLVGELRWYMPLGNTAPSLQRRPSTAKIDKSLGDIHSSFFFFLSATSEHCLWSKSSARHWGIKWIACEFGYGLSHNMWEVLVEGKNKPKKKTELENQKGSWRWRWHLTWFEGCGRGLLAREESKGRGPSRRKSKCWYGFLVSKIARMTPPPKIRQPIRMLTGVSAFGAASPLQALNQKSTWASESHLKYYYRL